MNRLLSHHVWRGVFLPTVGLALTGLVVTGCGRKGDPEMPGATPVKQETTKQKPVVQDDPFLLDPLL